MFAEVTMKKFIESAAKKELSPNEKLIKLNPVSVTNTTERRALNTGRGLRTGIYEQNYAALSIERRPEKMIYDICSRLHNGGFTYKNWISCDLEGKKVMLNNALSIMAQETHLPREIGEQLQLRFDTLESANGETNIFIRHFPETNQYMIINTPTITFNENVISNENFVKNLGTLFHECLHIMQQTATIEPFQYNADVVYWKDNMTRFGAYNNGSLTSYYSSPMEAYAHAQTGLFEKMYTGMMIDLENMKRRAG